MEDKYKLIVFDLDGTLVDSAPDIVATVQYIIKEYGFEPKEDAYIASCIGGGARNVLLKALGQDREQQIDAELLEVFKKYYLANCAVHSKLYPGIRDVLMHYSKAGKKLAVATFKVRNATEKILDVLDIGQYFDVVVTADDVEHPKPDPECILKIVEQIEIGRSKTILVGDTKTDLCTGNNASVDVCAVTYGYGVKEELNALNPTFLISEASELKRYI